MKSLALTGLTVAVVAAPLPALAETAPPSLDLAIVRGVNSFGAPALDWPMGVVSHNYFLAGAPLALAVAADHTTFKAPAAALVAEGLAGVSVTLLKPLFGRERPFKADPALRTPSGHWNESPESFPSGHAAVSFAAATAIADLQPSWAWPAYGLAALISYSRMYNGVHYPTDLLVGALLGIGAGKVTTWGMGQVTDRYGWPISGISTGGDALTLSVGRQF
ncbi:phosphatase PAP2 family protein [bacterium]|nr:phosphatase PAP2 family protein [bacterium]